MRPWYRRLVLYVAPSRNEGFGLTPLEAMASGASVVASDAGDHAEMIAESATGSIVSAGDGEALTRAIRRYMDSPDIAAEHGRNARAHVKKHFSLEVEAGGINSIYDKLWRDTLDSG